MIKEIQGLRSISVFLILFYHLNLSYFKLGFLAVDIFFIISGIIFSKIIFTNLINKNFSILEYTKRRINRLFPGLIILIFFVTIFSWLFLIPLELKYYGQSLFSTSIFISNIYYYIVNNDYFSPNTYSLLHLWSLSLELQFYILYPLLILFINKFVSLKKNFEIIFFFIFLASFYSNIYFGYDEKFAFYLLPTRFWEFILGYYIFIFIKKNQINYSLKHNFYLYLVNFFLIIYLVFGNNLIVKQQIIAVLIFLIIFFISYNNKNIFNSFLISSYNQNIANYSYTIFLVHYPVIYFYKYFVNYKGDLTDIFIILLLITVFTKFIFKLENYFFNSYRKQTSNNSTIKVLIILLMFSSFLGLFFHQTKGLKFRYLFNKNIADEYISYSKHFVSSKKINNESCNNLCKKIIGNKKSVLLFGDSHAGDFEFELTKVLNKNKINLYISYYDYKKSNLNALDHLRKTLEKEKSDYVFLIFHRKEKDDSIFYEKLKSLLDTYPEIKFYYFLQRIEFDEAPIKFKLLNKSFNKLNIINFEDFNKFTQSLNFPNLKVIDQNAYLLEFKKPYCKKLECFDGHDYKNLPLYRDNHHLTNYGVNLFINKLFKELSFN